MSYPSCYARRDSCSQNPRQLTNSTWGTRGGRGTSSGSLRSIPVGHWRPCPCAPFSATRNKLSKGICTFCSTTRPPVDPMMSPLSCCARHAPPVAPRPRCRARNDASVMAHSPCCARHAAPAMLYPRCRFRYVAFAVLRLSRCARHVALVMFLLPCCNRNLAPVALHLF